MQFLPIASGSKGNCYLVREEDALLLIEAGISTKAIRRGIGHLVSRLEACLVSHAHKDHSRSAAALSRCGVPIYCTQATMESLSDECLTFRRLNDMMDTFVIPPFAGVSFPTVHDSPGSLGFYVAAPSGDRLLFATDTGYIRERFSGITHLALECNWSTETLSPGTPPERLERLRKYHMSLEDVLAFCAANDLSRCREIHLLHLSDDNSDADLFRRRVEAATGVQTHIAADFSETIF